MGVVVRQSSLARGPRFEAGATGHESTRRSSAHHSMESLHWGGSSPRPLSAGYWPGACECHRFRECCLPVWGRESPRRSSRRPARRLVGGRQADRVGRVSVRSGTLRHDAFWSTGCVPKLVAFSLIRSLGCERVRRIELPFSAWEEFDVRPAWRTNSLGKRLSVDRNCRPGPRRSGSCRLLRAQVGHGRPEIIGRSGHSRSG